MKIKNLAVFFVFNIFSFLFAGNALARDYDLPPFVTINIYNAPTAVLAQDKAYLVYEMFITNYMSTPTTLISLEAIAGTKTLKLSTDELRQFIQPVTPENKPSFDFQPGESKVLFMWFSFDNLSGVPDKLGHQFTFNTPSDNQTYILHYEDVSINKTPIIVSAPLRGSNWATLNGLSNTSVHRISQLYFNGKPYVSERYAIDFAQIDAESSLFKGDPKKNSSYYCYNQDVLAVANAKVVTIKDGLPENIPASSTFAVPLNTETMGGNQITLDLGNGAFASYGHLIPGSIKVKVGDLVTPGQVIAKLGNSGHSDGPHLHFQITNKPSMLESDGVPYGFKQFNLIPTTLNGNRLVFSKTKPIQYVDQLPLEDSVIDFGNE